MNLKPGDKVIFGEDSDASLATVCHIGYPMSVLDFGIEGMPPSPCFTGGITRLATKEEIEAGHVLSIRDASQKGNP